MLLYKNGRIFDIKRRLGETRHEFMNRCWFFVNTVSTSAEATAWAARRNKGCSYGDLDQVLEEKAAKFTQ